MSLGSGVYFHELKDIHNVLGPFYVLVFFLMTTLLLVNFFVAILNDAYVDGCDAVADESNVDAIMSDFITTYIKSSLKDISKDLKKISVRRKDKSGMHANGSCTVRQKRKGIPPPEKEVNYFLY